MDTNIENTSQSFNATSPVLTAQAPATAQNAGTAATGETAQGDAEGGEAGTQQVAALPNQAPQPAGQDAAGEAAETEAKPAETNAGTPQPNAQSAAEEAAPANAAEQAAPAETPKQSGFLASFFAAGRTKKPAATQAALAMPEAGAARAAEAATKPAAKPSQTEPQPELSFENIAPLGEKAGRVGAGRNEPPEVKTVRAAAFADDGEGTGLPGVRQSALFEIKRKSGIDDDSDVDLHEEIDDGGSFQVASAAGLARLSPNGLLKQRESVDVACLKPSLIRVLRTIERRFGTKVVVTSGYRSPTYNRRVRGAKNSQHMYCAAADIQVPGVSKWEVANFVRSLPGRGGVGTYCHTTAVHVDVGPERDWNWRCRGRRA